MKKMKILLVVLIALASSNVSAQEYPVRHQLDSLVIRSFTAEPSQAIALAGIKGGIGDGVVYKCSKIAWDWTATNGGKPLDPNVEDVQAVAVINDSIFLAGTWKNGLFRSDDSGATWEKLTNFPSKDIRAIRVVDHGYVRIYAATTTAGIQESLDLGKTWKSCAADSMNKTLASWSIEVDPRSDGKLFALTFGNGIMHSNDHGKTWSSSLKVDGMMFYDLVFSGVRAEDVLAVGANDSTGVLYGSIDSGRSWHISKGTPEAQFSQVEFAGEMDKTIVLGSWNKGAFKSEGDSWNPIPQVSYENISGIYADASQMVFATWGDGFYGLGKKMTLMDISRVGPKILEESEVDAAYRARIEVILKRRVKRNQLQVVVKGYTQDVVGWTTMSDQPKPIYGRKKKFRRVESYLRGRKIRKKFGI
jgi:photosystem II stability/assembly factor-like uncharacterized protein